ncbi:hypothetical protein OROGR_023769 [Orobanche gracilis]
MHIVQSFSKIKIDYAIERVMRSCSLILLDLLPLSKPLALIKKVIYELTRSRDWAGLNVADNSCFHDRSEELDWNEMLIKRYIGREVQIPLELGRKFCFSKEKRKKFLIVSGASPQQQNASSPTKTYRSSALMKHNQRREASGRIIRTILMNRDTRQSSSGSQPLMRC